MASSYNFVHYSQNPLPFNSQLQPAPPSQMLPFPEDRHHSQGIPQHAMTPQPHPQLHPQQQQRHLQQYTAMQSPPPPPPPPSFSPSAAYPYSPSHGSSDRQISSYQQPTDQYDGRYGLPPSYNESSFGTSHRPQPSPSPSHMYPVSPFSPSPTPSASASASSAAPHPLSHKPSQLSQLIAIPATDTSLGSPFLRAYPPTLEGAGISRDQFLQFLDHLNRVAVASPPVQALSLAGTVVSLVPIATAQIVGNVVSTAADVTTVAMSKGRSELLLREANREIFGPHGLQVQIAKLDVVAKLAGIPILRADGSVDKRSPLLAPITNESELRVISAQQRRLNALRDWIAPLDLEALPDVDRSESAFGRMHAAVSERQRASGEKKMAKNREKAFKKSDVNRGAEYDDKMRELDEKEARIRNHDGRHMDRELKKVQEKRRKATEEIEKKLQKSDKERVKKDKEETSLRKISFLIVTTANKVPSV